MENRIKPLTDDVHVFVAVSSEGRNWKPNETIRDNTAYDLC